LIKPRPVSIPQPLRVVDLPGLRAHDRLGEVRRGNIMANRVVASIDNAAGDRCVDIFVRDDGTFGFEEFRRDWEDLRGWFPLQRCGSQSFASENEALSQARSSIAWLVDEQAR